MNDNEVVEVVNLASRYYKWYCRLSRKRRRHLNRQHYRCLEMHLSHDQEESK